MHKFYQFLIRYRLWHHKRDGSGIQVPPLSPNHLIFFIGFMLFLKIHKSYDSIIHYVSAVRTWAKANGRPDPAIDPIKNEPDDRYIKFVKSVKRSLAGKTIKRRPLEGRKFVEMLKIQSAIGSLTFQLNMRASLMMAWFALLRVSEYTSKTEEHNPEIHLCRRDIKFFPSQAAAEGYRVNIKISKTDQWRVGHTLVVYATGDPDFCPVRAMVELFENDPQPPNAPAFNFADPTVRSSRSSARRRFTTALNILVLAVGLEPMEVTSHSLRAGGATALLRAGVAPIVVTQLGRWKSWCWTTYTWASEHHIRQAHRDLVHANLNSDPVNLNAVRYANGGD